ncbi:MAG: flagellin [Nevskia sp.]|nr:flagellin [Nevskia sp.]
MSLIVNTNLSSLSTQNYLSTTQSQLAKATQQLASGLRINSAADDAAGYAISQRMTAQVNGSTTAIQNTNNAVSLAQTAQGSLAEITNNLQRVRELAVESANATNSASDRQSLNNEAQQLLQEVDRVASGASFNGVKLLDGSFQSQQFQVGANKGDTITVASITSARIATLGQSYLAQSTGTVAAATTVTGAGQLVINGKDIYQGSNIAADGQSLANAINNAGITGVTASASQTTVAGAAAATHTAANDGAIGTITINGVTTAGVTLTANATTNENNAISAINNISAATGVTAADNGSGEISLTAVDGRTITTSYAKTGGAGAAFGAGDIGGPTAGSAYSQVTLSSSNSSAMTTSGATATALGFAASTNAGLSGVSLANLDISTANGATTALTSLDAALSTINTTNGTLGAYQNRFQSAVANLQSTSQNLTAARSTIQDTDFAAATAAETRSSVLQQAGVAVLGQANSQPQQILSLLQHL